MRHTSLLLAASLTLGSFSLAPTVFAAPPASAAPQQQDKDHANADVKAARTLIGNSSDAATRENGFGDLVSNFSPPTSGPAQPMNIAGQPADKAHANPNVNETDKNSTLSSITSEQQSKLNDQIRLLRDAYKAKFRQDLSFKDPQTLYSDITSAEVVESQPQPAAAEVSASGANAPTPAQPANTNDKSMMATTDSPVLEIPAYENAPAISIRLVRSGSAFQFASPQQLNQPLLASNLTECLMKLNDHQGDWPADANTTTRLLSQHILGAIQKTLNAQANNNQTPNDNSGVNSMK